MKKNHLWLLLLCLLPMLLLSCARADEQQTVQRIVLEKKPSFGVIDEMSCTVISLTPNDRFIVQLLPLSQQEASPDQPSSGYANSVSSGKLKSGAFEQLAQLATLGTFTSLPNYIDTGVLDGHFTHIIAETDSEAVRKGGLVAEEYGPEAFRRLYDAIMKAIAEGTVDSLGTVPAPEIIWEIGQAPKLDDIRVVKAQILGDFLYVLEDIVLPYESYIPEHRLWRIQQGNDVKMLYPLGNVADFALSDKYLFATYVHREGFDRIDLDGNADSILELPIRPYLFAFQQDWLYYLAYDGTKSASYRCRDDGSEIEQLAIYTEQELTAAEKAQWLDAFTTP